MRANSFQCQHLWESILSLKRRFTVQIHVTIMICFLSQLGRLPTDGVMGYLSVTRAVGVRLLFASHGIVSIWRLADVSKDGRFWYLSGTLGLLFIESMVTLVKRQGKEWQWYVYFIIRANIRVRTHARTHTPIFV